MLDNALEKRITRKAKGADGCRCPVCNTDNEIFRKRLHIVDSDIVYCWHCGQATKIMAK